MKEHNRLRIERLTARYDQRIRAPAAPDEADFLGAFADLTAGVLRPQMEELAALLREAGHQSRVVLDQGPDRPSIELALGLQRGTGTRNVIGFSVLRWSGYPLQILAYLEISPPAFDLERFARAEDISPGHVEQMLVDAVEHVLSVNAP
jgi:hypothetical protein